MTAVVDLLLRLVGAFYIFAGITAVRATLFSGFLDKALAALSGTAVSAREQRLQLWLAASSVLVGLSGLALMLLWDGAAYLFSLSAGSQGVYLAFLAPWYFDKLDPPDPVGRRQTRTAFFIYLIATAMVIAAAATGFLFPLDDLPAPSIVLALVAAAGGIGWVAWEFRKPIKQPSESGYAPLADDDVEPIHNVQARGPGELPRRIMVMAEIECFPTWEVTDVSQPFDPSELPVSAAWLADVTAWSAAFETSLDLDHPAGPSLWSPAQFAVHEAEGRRLAIRLARELAEAGHGDIEVACFCADIGRTVIRASDPLS